MQQIELNIATRVQTHQPSWYRIYTLALLEANRDQAVKKINSAQKAIHERLTELDSAAPTSPREPRDLRNAQTYLRILSRHIGSESASIFWDCPEPRQSA